MSLRAGPGWRTTALARLAEQTFDALVVGGGATGVAIARDAALRGLQVALCERGDFAAETSSYSSKLIHGGLRYLEHGDLPLVFEALAERRHLLRTAPHLCRPIEFVFPAYEGASPRLATLMVGVALYDALALWRPPAGSRRISSRELYTVAPWLRTAGLRGAALYTDCQTDDARLVLETALDAEAAGAVVATYVEIDPPRGRSSGHLRAVTARDRLTGARLTIRARAIVNATGPFSDAFASGPRALRPTLGVHLVVDAERLPTGGRGFVLRAPRDRRIVFVLPAGARTLIGTTDTTFSGQDDSADGRGPRPGVSVEARAEDVAYLLDVAAHAFPAARLVPADVISTFAGLRPLLASDASSPSAASREHTTRLDDAGVLTVAGGKLTTMRSMAEETVDQLSELLRTRGFDRPLGPCLTKERPLPGAAGGLDTVGAALDRHELAPDVREHLAATYGGRVGILMSLADSEPALLERLDPELPYLHVELVFAARHDHALGLEDALRRRVPLFRNAADQGLGVAERAAAMLARELTWSAGDLHRNLEAYRVRVAASRGWRSAVLPGPSAHFFTRP